MRADVGDLTARKPEHRRGKVQLIDATQWFKPLRKNLGKKNCELSEEDIARICDTFLDFKETEGLLDEIIAEVDR